MTSDLAQGDLDDLRAEGCVPTDADVVRLHALGLRVSTGPDQSAVNAPRFAWAGGVLFHEPTLAAYEWYRRARGLAADEATDDWLFAFACAHGRDPGLLEGLSSRSEIERALGAFFASIHGTRGEVTRALEVVTGVADAVEPEPTELERREAADARIEAERRSYACTEKILAAAAAATGLGYMDLMAQTPSRLNAMVYAHHVIAGVRPSRSNALAYAQYLAALKVIATRLRAERDARKRASAASAPRPATETGRRPSDV